MTVTITKLNIDHVTFNNINSWNTAHLAFTVNSWNISLLTFTINSWNTAPLTFTSNIWNTAPLTFTVNSWNITNLKKNQKNTDTARAPSYFDLLHEMNSHNRLRTNLYVKRDDFNFPIVSFPFICGSIPAASAYGVYIS
jgi:hypothetical protein